MNADGIDQTKALKDHIKYYAFSKWIVFSFGMILFVAGVAKIWSSFGNSKLLATPDPIVGISFSRLMLVAGLVELCVALICWRCNCRAKNIGLAAFLVAWLSTSFLGYRLGMWWMHWKRPCNCLGNLTDALHISPQTADTAMKIILAYLLIGSYATLFWLWWQRKKAIPASLPAE
ncbi:MAG TPA: hypothetical protein VIK59_09925 [Verrucomicrobiae bacterium]